MRKTKCPCSWPCDRVDENTPLMARSAPISWARGDVLWEEDTTSDWVLAVCTGAVGLGRGEATGAFGLVDIAVRGDLTGEETASDARRPVGCIGLVAGKGRKLEKRDLSRSLAADPNAWNTILCTSTRRAAALAGRLHASSAGTVETRLANLLLGLAERLGLRDARGTLIPLPLPRIDLAQLTGCREETVVRRMTAWERDGLVSTLREGFLVHDVLALRALGGDAAT